MASQTSQASRDRLAFREHALDGAALFFQPATGVHVRVATEATRQLRRRAPRVAMFGITNACNLRCAFCSRDVTRSSEWTVASATAALRGLHDAGTLEVAYGGGEPFAFRGFAELVSELHETTALAQHVTTNGTLILRETWRPFAGRFGQVRVSIYEEDGAQVWQRAAEVLSEAGQLWGGNVLVDAAALLRLPRLLEELAERGCHDVSLLSYVGPDRSRQLDGAGAARLAQVIEAAPLACRISVCFGDRVPVARLATGDAPAGGHDGHGGGGDCGAGRDFLSITPDRRVQSCSFQERSVAGGTAEEILAAWRLQQVMLAAPSPRAGCARALPMMSEAEAPPPIAIWRGFSGNNSGECVMVASFRTVADAEGYLAELVPGWVPDQLSPAWQQLFDDEAIAVASPQARAERQESWGYDGSPEELVAIGRTVMASRYGLEPMFPELAALAWKRGARTVLHAGHMHGCGTVVVAIQSRDAADRARLQATRLPELVPGTAVALRTYVHGELVIATMPVLNGPRAMKTLEAARDAALALAGGRPFAAELYPAEIEDAELIAAKQRLGDRPARVPRLCVSFYGQDGEAKAGTFSRMIFEERVTLAGSAVLIDPAPDRKRLAVLGYRHGGYVQALDEARLTLMASVWYVPPPRPRKQQPKPARPPAPPMPVRRVEADHLERVLRATLPAGAELTIDRRDDRACSLVVTSEQPAAAMVALRSYAQSIEARLNVWVREQAQLPALLRRVVGDVIGNVIADAAGDA